MARPETHPGVDEGDEGERPESDDVARPGTGVVRPGTGVVRPISTTGVVRPSAGGGVGPPEAAKASAAVPEAPSAPLEPIHVVLPVIPVKPVKQGFLDRLVAPKPKKEKKDKKDRKRKAEPDELEDSEEAYDEDDDSGPEHEEPAANLMAPPAPVAPAPVAPASPPPMPPAPVRPPPPPLAPPRPEHRPEPRPEPVRVEPPRPAPPPLAPARGPRPGQGWVPRPERAAPRRERVDTYGDDWPVEDEEWSEEDEEWAPRRRISRIRVLVGALVIALISAAIGYTVGVLSPQPTGSSTWLAGAQSAPAGPVLGQLADNAPEPSPVALAAKIDSLLGNPALSTVTASVVDVSSGDTVFERAGGAAVTPASTAKLLTAAAVLAARGPAYQIPTRVVAGPAPGEVVIIGGGDPTLAAGPTGSYPDAARLDLLAKQVTQALNGQPATKVIVDSSLFSGPTVASSWEAPDIASGYISHITPLMTDGARQNPKRLEDPSPRFPEPDISAAQIFAKDLGLPESAVTTGVAISGAQQLGVVYSPPISRIVEMMLEASDNVIAEMMARQVAVARGVPASFDGATVAIRNVLRSLGIATDGLTLVDGSGLSASDRVSAQLLTQVLAKAAGPSAPQLRAVLTGLPVAGWSGTLSGRYSRSTSGSSAAGIVRAKTGTLADVNALAGIAVDADGRLLAFALVANGTKSSAQAEIGLDRVAAAVASCGC